MIFNCRGKILDLSSPVIMGILNITPDSFYELSRFKTKKHILRQAGQMLSEGALILDIGGVSSRPNAGFVSEKEELNRVIPVVRLIRDNFPDAFISVDTFRSEVAEQAILEGVHLINDISASEIDETLSDVIAKAGIPYVLMHMQGTPETMQKNPEYQDVSLDVMDFFIKKIAFLKNKGIHDIILDVGFGFGKSIEHNYQLLSNLHIYKCFDLPLMIGISRKSMIWKVLKSNPQDALNGTTALHMIALQQGAGILRVHDVKAAAEVIKLWERL
jgi:dihydropteroate synthase